MIKVEVKYINELGIYVMSVRLKGKKHETMKTREELIDMVSEMPQGKEIVKMATDNPHTTVVIDIPSK